MDRRKLMSRGLAALSLSLVPSTLSALTETRLVTTPVENYAAIIRKTVERMAQDAVGKPEKGNELALLRLYVDTVREHNPKDEVQIGWGTFTGTASEYVSIIDVVHWYVYGEWGAARSPKYWAQRSNGEWYII